MSADERSGFSRREVLARGILFGGTLVAAAHLPRPRALAAAAASSQPEVLSPGEWATVESITGRLIPTDHEPGAIEAGCVNFIDKALANEDAAAKPTYTAGLAGVDAVASKRWGKPFVGLEPTRQDELLAALEDGRAEGWPDGDVDSQAFFAQIWNHTVWGFLSDPKYGGNRDFAGWRVLGYPGGRHKLGGYTPAQMAGKARLESVWGEVLPRKPGGGGG